MGEEERILEQEKTGQKFKNIEDMTEIATNHDKNIKKKINRFY